MPDLALLVQLLQLPVKDRAPPALENIALCHQLAVYEHGVRLDITHGQRAVGKLGASFSWAVGRPGGRTTLSRYSK